MIQLSNFPTKKQQYSGYLLLALICFIAFLFSDTLNQYAMFERHDIVHGQYWRMLSAHVVHTNAWHLLLNLFGLLLLWSLHGEYQNFYRFISLFLVISLLTSGGLLHLTPNIDWYMGASGTLHGLFAWGVIQDIKHKRISGYLLLLGLAIKLVDERWFSSSQALSQLIDANVAIDGHLFGAISGLVLSVFMRTQDNT